MADYLVSGLYGNRDGVASPHLGPHSAENSAFLRLSYNGRAGEAERLGDRCFVSSPDFVRVASADDALVLQRTKNDVAPLGYFHNPNLFSLFCFGLQVDHGVRRHRNMTP